MRSSGPMVLVQIQNAGVGTVIVVQRGRQLGQDGPQVLGAEFQRDRLGVVLPVRHMVLLLHDIREGVVPALLFKGVLNQRLRVGARGQGVGLDELLAAVEVLNSGVGRHLQGAGVGHQRRRQQQTGEQSLHCRFLLLQKNTALSKVSVAVRVMGTMGFMCVFPP